MLTRVRSSADSPTMLGILGIIIITFVFWGIGGQGQTSSVLAEVNGQRLTDTEFNNEMRRERYARPGTLSDEAYDGVAAQVLTRMITWEILLQEANRLRIEVSNAEIAQAIQDDPTFADDNGEFAVELYHTQVKRYYGSQSRYETKLAETMRINRLEDMAVRGARISPTTVKNRYIEDNTRISLEWVRVPDASILPLVEVSEDAVAAYLASSEDTLRSAYDALLDSRFSTSRRATTHTILMKIGAEDIDDAEVRASLEAIHTELAGIEDNAARLARFKEIAAESSQDLSSKDGGDRGERTADQMGPVITEAVFAADPKSGLTAIVETATDLQVLLVDEVFEAQTTSFEDARGELAREMVAQDNLGTTAESFVAELKASWETDGTPSQELMDKADLIVRAEPTATLGTPVLRDLGPATEIMADASTAAPESVLPKIYEVRGERVIARLISRTEADMSTYEEQSGALEMRMLNEERQRLLTGWRNALVEQADVKRYWTGNNQG
ncbi:MAG: SurA N-terminal domain-containing protein [Myxococcota bacterium]|nr:SurA N-terminal domain-containing protein [Myxococcota bacterium]